MKLCLFVNITSNKMEMNGAKVQIFTQQLKYFKHFFQIKVLFFYQNGIFTHFLLTNTQYVQSFFSYF